MYALFGVTSHPWESQTKRPVATKITAGGKKMSLAVTVARSFFTGCMRDSLGGFSILLCVNVSKVVALKMCSLDGYVLLFPSPKNLYADRFTGY